MTALYNFGDQPGVALRDPAENEAGGLYARLVKQIEQPARVRLHAAGIRLPLLPSHDTRKGFDVKIVFHVDTKNISALLRVQWLVPVLLPCYYPADSSCDSIGRQGYLSSTVCPLRQSE